MRNKAINRRRFLKRAAGTAAGAMSFPYIVSSSAFGAGEKITVGCVGVGPQGSGVMGNFLRQKDARVVAVCDVKDPVLKAAQDRVNKHYKGTGCATYKDFRELMARDALERKESCGGHFREESAEEDGPQKGEAKRDDANFAYVAAWEWTGNPGEPKLHKEELTFNDIELKQRSYK